MSRHQDQSPPINDLHGQASLIVTLSIGQAFEIPVTRQQWIVSAYSLYLGYHPLLWRETAGVYGASFFPIPGSSWGTLLILTTVCQFYSISRHALLCLPASIAGTQVSIPAEPTPLTITHHDRPSQHGSRQRSRRCQIPLESAPSLMSIIPERHLTRNIIHSNLDICGHWCEGPA
jgi:hypothetical protein